VSDAGRAAGERVARALALGRELRPAKGVRMDGAAIAARLRRVAQLRDLGRQLRVAVRTDREAR
jgi:hypothetical protein